MAKIEEKLPKLALDLKPPAGGKGSGAELDIEAGEPVDNEPAEGEASPEEQAVFGDLKAAIKGGDDAAGAAALKTFIKLCGGY